MALFGYLNLRPSVQYQPRPLARPSTNSGLDVAVRRGEPIHYIHSICDPPPIQQIGTAENVKNASRLLEQVCCFQKCFRVYSQRPRVLDPNKTSTGSNNITGSLGRCEYHFYSAKSWNCLQIRPRTMHSPISFDQTSLIKLNRELLFARRTPAPLL